jgi:iron(III) transport system ATP-binding protein
MHFPKPKTRLDLFTGPASELSSGTHSAVSQPRLRWPIHNAVQKLAALFFLAVLVQLSGCGSPLDHQLPVSETNYFLMPSEGTKVPAPRAVHITPTGELYVLDNAGRVLVFDAAGKVIRKWWMPEYSVGKPEKICLLRDGRLAVADTHYHRIVFFNPAGKVVGMMGAYGREPGEFIFPVAIAQDDQENLYICEYGNNDRVQKFSPSGVFLTQFGSFGNAPGQFIRPSGIVWHDHKIYVVDAFNNRIQYFTDDGKYLGIFGNSSDAGLYYPYDLIRGVTGDFYVVEYGAGRVSKFSSEGQLIGHFGKTGKDENELETPWGLTIDARNRIWVADTGNRRIVEWQL